jgi:CHAD domain-containing protein
LGFAQITGHFIEIIDKMCHLQNGGCMIYSRSRYQKHCKGADEIVVSARLIEGKGFVMPLSARKSICEILTGSLPGDAQLHVLGQAEETVDWQLLDTFGSHVGKSGQLLLQDRQQLHLLDLKSGTIRRQRVRRHWRFPDDLADGPVKLQLHQLDSLRAYSPLRSFPGKLVSAALLDDQEKTVGRLLLYNLQRPKKAACLGIVQPLRGYDEECELLMGALQSAGAAVGDDLGTLYALLDLPLSTYTAKPDLELDDQATAKDSVAHIISVFLGVATANEHGIIDDLDTEFLHDYRVSLRKVRSALSLFAGVYEEQWTIRLKLELATLMRATNRLRDLDVYLLAKKNFSELLPTTNRAGLAALFSYLARERRKEHKNVVAQLSSAAYRAQMDQLRLLFERPGQLPEGPEGGSVFRPYAAELILARYRKMSRAGRKIDGSTPDEKVHRLRIHGKKLRYLLEFSGGLFAEAEVKMLIKALKGLQDNLGNFNDYSVQQCFLKQLLSDNLRSFRGKELQLAETVGAATAILYQLQQEERGQVMSNIEKFDSPETREAVQLLFDQELIE